MTASFIDKVIIYILGAVTIVLNYNQENIVAYLLIGAILLGITQCLLEFRYWLLEYLVYGIFMLSAIVYPLIAPFMGICIYTMVYKYFNRKVVTLTYILASGLLFIYLAGRLMIAQNVLVCFIIIISAILGIKTHMIESLYNSIKKLRDDSIEAEQTLKERNNYLMQNQDNEVHIATLNERNRIAREIHDNVGHMLSRGMLQLGAIMAIEQDEMKKRMLSPLKDTLDVAMNNIRESVHDLHKDSFDLKAAVHTILEELTGYEVKLEYDMSMETDKEVKYSFLTILKEAVTNIIKHSNANTVEITMRELDNYYQMVIEDNGIVEKNIHNVDAGIGLTNMEERIKKLSGFISFSTDNGFRIFVSVPKDNMKK